MPEKNHINYAFDRFQIDVQKRRLLRDGQVVQLTSKAFDLLVALIESDGREVTKDELFERVWPNQIIEDANLTVMMSHVRKALGEKAGEHRFIVTIPGRGYRFVGELQPQEELIIEQRTISHIIIEKESTTEDKSIIKPVAQTQVLSQENGFVTNTNEAVAMVSLVKALPQSEIKSLRRRRFTLLLSGGLVLVLLLAGGFYVWRYKLQEKNQNRSSQTPFGKMTIKQLTAKGGVANAVISPDGKFYAYTLAERGENKYSLWLGQVDGSSERQLRPPEDFAYRGLAFSHDSTHLYFVATLKNSPKSALYKMPVLGGVLEKLRDGVPAFTLSPDEKQIAFFSKSNERGISALYLTNIDGSETRELATRPLARYFSTVAPAWSPDGSLLAVGADSESKGKEIYIVRVEDGSIKQLTTFYWRDVANLVWRRDGQGLIAIARDRDALATQLWQIDYPSGNPHRLSHDVGSYSTALSLSSDSSSLLAVQVRQESNVWVAPADDLGQARQVTFSSIGGFYGWDGLDWTPDNKILFTAAKDQDRFICIVDADGSNLKQLTSAGFKDLHVSATPDGRFIVFQSNRSGRYEIWRANIDGSDLKPLTIGGSKGSPNVTPDGRWVVYKSHFTGKGITWRVSIEGGETFVVIDTDSSYPQVSPDGKLIACAYKANDKTPVQIAVVPFEGGAPVKVFNVPRNAGVHGLRWTPDGKALLYRDWSNGMWLQDLNGGEPQRPSGLPEDALHTFGWSRDGKLFAFTRGREMRDAVLIKNFN